jgi:hypothetical protein
MTSRTQPKELSMKLALWYALQVLLYILTAIAAWMYRDFWVPGIMDMVHVFIDPIIYLFEWIGKLLRYALRS